jgi:hypothetical protein
MLSKKAYKVLVALVTEVDNCIDVPHEDCRA